MSVKEGPGPITIQVQIDPEALNGIVPNQVFGPVDPKHYPEIEALMLEFVGRLDKFGYTRYQMWTNLWVEEIA